MRFLVSVSAVLATLAVVSCGQSKEDAAIQRILNRKPPGSVRLVNLLDKPVRLWIDSKEASNDIAPGQATIFIATPAGNHDLSAKSGLDNLATHPITTGNREDLSAVLYEADGKPQIAVVKGEPRRKQTGRVVVVCVLVDPANGAADVKAGSISIGSKVPAMQPTELKDVIPGDVTFDVTVGAKHGKLDAKVEDSTTYSLVVFPGKSKVTATILQNSAAKAGMAGSAAG